MIELLLEAERALSHGLLDQAERRYRQVAESDPRSSIALVGLARVALERDDLLAAYLHGRKALAIDPENPAAAHLVMRMAEVLAGRGEAVPESLDAPGAAGPEAPVGPADPVGQADPAAGADPPPAPSSAYRPPSPGADGRPRPGLVGRLLGRRRR